MHKFVKWTILILITVCLIQFVGCKPKQEPKEVITNAFEKTKNENGLHIRTKLDIDNKDFILDNKNLSYITKGGNVYIVETVNKENNEKVNIELFYIDKNLYLKDIDEDIYIQIDKNKEKSILPLTTDINIKNNLFKILEKDIIKNIKNDNIEVVKDNIFIEKDVPIRVKKYFGTINKDIIKKSIDEFYRPLIYKTISKDIEELIEFQISSKEKINEKTLSDEEKNKICNDVESKIKDEINIILDNMKYSDIKYNYYIDKNNIIRKKEYNYYVKIKNKKINIKYTTFILDYGENIEKPIINKDKVISEEEYKNKKDN